MHQYITKHRKTQTHVLFTEINVKYDFKSISSRNVSAFAYGVCRQTELGWVWCWPTNLSFFLCLPASFLPASVRYGSRSKLQQRWFTFSLLMLCSAKSPRVLALLPFQTLFSVYSSLSRSPFPYCWQTELLHSGKCHIIQQRDAVCRHTHTHQSTCSPPSPFPLFLVCLFPRSASIADFVFFFCLILMFSDSEV